MHSRYIYPQLKPFLLWPLVALWACALAYATTSFWSEIDYAAGRWGEHDTQTDLSRLERAAKIFPIEHNTRAGPALFLLSKASREPDLRQPASEAFDTMLIENPYSAAWLGISSVLKAQLGDMDGARARLKQLQKMGVPVIIQE